MAVLYSCGKIIEVNKPDKDLQVENSVTFPFIFHPKKYNSDSFHSTDYLIL